MSDTTSDETRALKSILRAAVEALGLEFDETPASPLRLSASVVREDELDAAVFKVRIPLYALRDLKRKAADARSVLSRLQRAIVDALPEGATAIGKIDVRMPARCDDIALTVECSEGGVVVNTGSSPLTDDESAAFDRQQSRLDAFERGAADPHPPGSRITANVAAFVLKAPALDRLLLVMSNKKGRAWELPGGAIEPGGTPADAAGREVVEEAGIYFRAEGSGWTVDGCEVFRGTSHASLTVPGGDVTSARWFTAEEARALKLSDLPTAALIREWSTPIGEPAIRAAGGRPAQVLDSPEHRARVLAPRSHPPTDDPADHWVAWRGSASDFVTDMRRVIPPEKLAFLRVLLGESDPPRPATPPNVAAFVLRAPKHDRLLLVRSGKAGRAWELPGGAVEPGEEQFDAVLREVKEETGAVFHPDSSDPFAVVVNVEGCAVFRGYAWAPLTAGGDALEAHWFERADIAVLNLSDLPTAALIRAWVERR